MDPLQLLTAGLGVVIWFVRLEGRIKAVEREAALLAEFVKSLDAQQRSFADKITSDLSIVKEALARIEGKLERE